MSGDEFRRGLPVCRVMRALDGIAEEVPNGPWEQHLRRMAEAAVDAMDAAA